MSLDPKAFKNAMSRWGSGVTVVTSVLEDNWKGTTASSFSSVSAEPPLILICLANRLYTREVLLESGVFAVNILSNEQLEIGKLFAGMYPEIEDRFEGQGCITSETGSPIFPNSLAWVDCEIASTHEEGDHTIFVGRVLSANTQDDKQPLLYYHRQWGQFNNLD